MDLYRAFLAIVLSFLILLGYQYFFPHPLQETPAEPQQAQQQTQPGQQATPGPAAPAVAGALPPVTVDPTAREITVDTPLFTAVIKEQGGGFKSFVLKNYRQGMAGDSGPMQLVPGRNITDLPVLFSLDNGAGTTVPTYRADREKLTLAAGQGTGQLVMTATPPDGLRIKRTLTFHADSYLIDAAYAVENPTDRPLQVSPALTLGNEPFVAATGANTFLFFGPAVYMNGELVETKG